MTNSWGFSSTPAGRFPEGIKVNDWEYNFNRAKFSFYVIDPLFLRNNNLTPPHIKADPNTQSSHFVEEVFEGLEIEQIGENQNARIDNWLDENG